jgi:hypothetical protein
MMINLFVVILINGQCGDLDPLSERVTINISGSISMKNLACYGVGKGGRERANHYLPIEEKRKQRCVLCAERTK